MPDDLRLTPAEAVQLAQRLIDEGRPFHAHEVLEAVWKASPSAQRDLWQGLAQIAVGLTHARRGNGRGAVALLRRGAAAVGHYLPAAADERAALPDALDLAGVRAAATGLADLIAARGLGAVTADDVRLKLGPPAKSDSGPKATLLAAAGGHGHGQALAFRDVVGELAGGQRVSRLRHGDRRSEHHPIDPAVGRRDQRAA
jgi:uncharacterized protein